MFSKLATHTASSVVALCGDHCCLFPITEEPNARRHYPTRRDGAHHQAVNISSVPSSSEIECGRRFSIRHVSEMMCMLMLIARRSSCNSRERLCPSSRQGSREHKREPEHGAEMAP